MTQLTATTLLLSSNSDAAGRATNSRTDQADASGFAAMFADQQAEREAAGSSNNSFSAPTGRQNSDTEAPQTIAPRTAEIKPTAAQRDLFSRDVLTDEEAAVATEGEDWLALLEAMQAQLQQADETATVTAETQVENNTTSTAATAEEEFEAWLSDLPEDVQNSLRQVFAELDVQAFAATMAPYLSKLQSGETVSGAAMLRDLQTQFPQLQATELAAAATTTMYWQQLNHGHHVADGGQLKLLPVDSESGGGNTQAILTATLKELMGAAAAARQQDTVAQLAVRQSAEQHATAEPVVDGRPLKSGAPVESPRLAALLAQLQALTTKQEQELAARQQTGDLAKQIEQTAKQLLQAAQAADDAAPATTNSTLLAALQDKGLQKSGKNFVNNGANKSGEAATKLGTDSVADDAKALAGKSSEPKSEFSAEVKSELRSELRAEFRTELKPDLGAVETKLAETKPQSALLAMQQQARDAAQAIKAQPTQFEQTLRQAQQPLPLVAEQASQVLRERVMLMLGNGIQRADIRLDPPDLGAMSIRLSIQNDQAQVSFQVQNQQARDSIEQALPRLREMLEQQGLQLAGSDVSEQGKGGHTDAEGHGSSAEQQADSEADWQVEVALNAGEPLEPGRVDFFA